MTRRIHSLHVPLVFPAGIAPGNGGDYNTLVLARNGQGAAVLRGTSLAGVLRHAWEESPRNRTRPDAIPFFGSRSNEDGEVPSLLQVRDCVLDMGGSTVAARTHHLRDRHLGSVADGGLFTMEICPPGTRTVAVFSLRDEQELPDESTAFLQQLLSLFQRGITLGGKGNRGIGLARLDGHAVHRVYDLSRAEDHAAWLDDDRRRRQTPDGTPSGQPLMPVDTTAGERLEIQLRLGIPRGQDLLVGDGRGLEHEIEPQRVAAADGRQYWRLPGSTLRGLFRSWITRLAARDGLSVADNVQRQKRVWTGALANSDTDQMNGANLGWCFLPKDQRKSRKAKTDCPVALLFGTLFRAGRIQIYDAYAPCSAAKPGDACAEEQLRRHVAVDALTGGAAEGMLFDNTVLTALPNGRSPEFAVTIVLDQPTSQEAAWVAKTIRALDLGILRVGSSKSSGRLCLLAPPQATGPHAEQITTIKPDAPVSRRR